MSLKLEEQWMSLSLVTDFGLITSEITTCEKAEHLAKIINNKNACVSPKFKMNQKFKAKQLILPFKTKKMNSWNI